MNRALIFLSLLICGCVAVPENVKPVHDFNLEKYLGKWYEIARLDHSFERGLTRVTATYSMRDDGGVKVVNRGYSEKDDAWRQAEGKAYFVKTPDVGYLKVSFFGPFYGSYVVFELDKKDYEYSAVSGPDKSYLWVLARRPTIKKELLDRIIKKAAALGFDTDKLILVSQDTPTTGHH